MRLSLPYRSILIGNLLIGFGTLGIAQAPSRIARVAQHYSTKDGFSGTVTFATAGKVIFWHGYGFANRTQKSEFNEHTRLNIGSVSKQFTAAAILLLQEDGRLKTTDHIAQLLPEDNLPQAWSEITIRELLSHTSGLKDYAIAALQERQLDRKPAELLALVRDAPLAFRPGENYEYSNTNYLLLGQIVEKLSAMPYCQFLHRRIFDPLGMRDTQCLEEAGALEHHAIGYAPDDSGDGKASSEEPPTSDISSSFYFGAGSLVSTGDDLVRWASALHHGRVLSEASYREMTTPVRNGYGYAFQVESLRGHLRLDHSGDIPGFYSELEYVPETDNTVVILSNQNSFPKGQVTPGTHAIDSELMTIAGDPKASVPSEDKDVLTSPRVLRLFTGKYVSNDGKLPSFTISLKGDHLQLLEEGPGHRPSKLRGDYGELDFYISDEELLEFSGQNEAMIFDLQRSRALPFHRVSPGAAGREDK